MSSIRLNLIIYVIVCTCMYMISCDLIIDQVTHGNMEVTSIQEEINPSYTLSSLTLKNLEVCTLLYICTFKNCGQFYFYYYYIDVAR